MRDSRTKNVARNAVFGVGTQFFELLLNFTNRTFFIKLLGSEYLGISGLFTNILTILSFAELGIGNAIVFSLYKPLAEKDNEKIKSLMLLYKKAYRFIGMFVAVAGIACIPFMDFIIKDKPNISENLIVIYLMYLFNTASSYFYSYKKSIIIADQKNYIVTIYAQVFNTVRMLIQIVCLYLTHDFMLYLIIQIGSTLLDNIALYIKSNKMYPFLKEEAVDLEKSEKKSIFSNVKALVMYKFGSIILNGTDNIIISAMVGVKAVGLVSNYLLIINAFASILRKILDAFTASVGNLNATGTDQQRYGVFNKMFFINTWLYGFLSVGVLALVQEAITWWIGGEFLLPFLVEFAVILHFYVNGVHNAAYTYRTTLGYFVQGRYTPVCAAILNIILSIVLCKYIGLSGIFFATSISRFFVIQIVDVALVYKKTFKISPFKYYLKFFMFFLVYIGIYIIIEAGMQYITISGIWGLIVKAVFITLVYNLIMFVLFGRTSEFKDLLTYLKALKRR